MPYLQYKSALGDGHLMLSALLKDVDTLSVHFAQEEISICKPQLAIKVWTNAAVACLLQQAPVLGACSLPPSTTPKWAQGEGGGRAALRTATPCTPRSPACESAGDNEQWEVQGLQEEPKWRTCQSRGAAISGTRAHGRFSCNFPVPAHCLLSTAPPERDAVPANHGRDQPPEPPA